MRRRTQRSRELLPCAAHLAASWSWRKPWGPQKTHRPKRSRGMMVSQQKWRVPVCEHAGGDTSVIFYFIIIIIIVLDCRWHRLLHALEEPPGGAFHQSRLVTNGIVVKQEMSTFDYFIVLSDQKSSYKTTRWWQFWIFFLNYLKACFVQASLWLQSEKNLWV